MVLAGKERHSRRVWASSPLKMPADCHRPALKGKQRKQKVRKMSRTLKGTDQAPTEGKEPTKREHQGREKRNWSYSEKTGNEKKSVGGRHSLKEVIRAVWRLNRTFMHEEKKKEKCPCN